MGIESAETRGALIEELEYLQQVLKPSNDHNYRGGIPILSEAITNQSDHSFLQSNNYVSSEYIEKLITKNRCSDSMSSVSKKASSSQSAPEVICSDELKAAIQQELPPIIESTIESFLPEIQQAIMNKLTQRLDKLTDQVISLNKETE